MISLAIRRIQRKWHIQIDLHKRKDNSAIVTQQWTASNISQEIHSYFPRMTISNWLGNSLSSFFFQSIFSLAALEAATYRWTTPPVVALPFYPDAISMAFVISRIIKYYVTIIFIQLSVLGLIANYCYWVSRDSANCSISLNDFFSLVDALNPVWKSPRAHDMMNIKTIEFISLVFCWKFSIVDKTPPFHGKKIVHIYSCGICKRTHLYFLGIFTFQPLEILFIIVWYMHETHSNIWFLCEREISDWNLQRFESNAIQISHDK